MDTAGSAAALAALQAALLLWLLRTSEGEFLFLAGWPALLAGVVGNPSSQEQKLTMVLPLLVSRMTLAYSPLAWHAW